MEAPGGGVHGSPRKEEIRRYLTGREENMKNRVGGGWMGRVLKELTGSRRRPRFRVR